MVFLFYELLWTGNELGVEGAKVIAKALASNRTLTTLNLQCTDSVMHWRRRHEGTGWLMTFLLYELFWAANGLEVEAAKLIAKALESNYTLTTLYLGGTDSVMYWRRHQRME
jgi:hypothetical protein